MSDPLEAMEFKDLLELRAQLVSQVLQEQKELTEPRRLDLQEVKVLEETQVLLELLGPQETLDQQEVKVTLVLQ